MRIHTCLWNEVQAFHFDSHALMQLSGLLPTCTVTEHHTEAALLAAAADADIVLAWEFKADWYPHFEHLTHILTPAAGTDWIEPDPSGRVKVVHGSFHGDILSESLISAVLFMNHRMPDMIRNHAARQWDRNLQTDARLLKNQRVLIIGMGSIGEIAAQRFQALGVHVTGVTASGRAIPGVDTFKEADLPKLLPEADHVVLLLPGNPSTDGYLSLERILQCKPGVYLYNFGRGNVLTSRDVAAAANHIGGAFLDVTDEEPLPPDSPLWALPNVMITPHSSCVYQEYREMFLDEAASHIKHLMTAA